MSRYIQLPLVASALVLAVSCGTSVSDTDTKTRVADTVAVAPPQIEAPAEPEVPEVDWRTDPLLVMETMFDAARMGDYTKLAGMCDPKGTGDDDTKSICAMATASEKARTDFNYYYRFGKVLGEPVISGDTAEVHITFGPRAEWDVHMRMIRRDGFWYLVSF